MKGVLKNGEVFEDGCGIKDFFLVCFLRMGENSAGRQDEPLSRPFLDPQAPSDLDSSLHVDLGVSEPAHV